jgi:CheY-like chemotaxis protein
MQIPAAVDSRPSSDPFPSILIVDEDADSRLLYRLVLQRFAETFFEAEDGEEALTTALCRRPDVIVADTRLPGIDGCALCSRLRQEPMTSSAAIVIITAGALPADIARATQAGADEVVVKPCLPDDLRAAAERSWHRRHPAADQESGDGATRPIRS